MRLPTEPQGCWNVKAELATNRVQVSGPVPTNGSGGLVVSLLTSMVGVSMCASVIVAIHVQCHIVLAHKVHDLQHTHAMQHTFRDQVKWVYTMGVQDGAIGRQQT